MNQDASEHRLVKFTVSHVTWRRHVKQTPSKHLLGLMFMMYKSDLKLQEVHLSKYLCAAFKLKSCLLFLKTSSV